MRNQRPQSRTSLSKNHQLSLLKWKRLKKKDSMQWLLKTSIWSSLGMKSRRGTKKIQKKRRSKARPPILKSKVKRRAIKC